MDNMHMVRSAVIGERDGDSIARERCAIEINRRHTSRNAVWVLDDDVVARRVISERDRKALLQGDRGRGAAS
jgi:hypothetical protein